MICATSQSQAVEELEPGPRTSRCFDCPLLRVNVTILLREDGKGMCIPRHAELLSPRFPLMLTILTPTSGYLLGTLAGPHQLVLLLGWVLLKMMLEGDINTVNSSGWWWQRTRFCMHKDACAGVFTRAPGHMFVCGYLHGCICVSLYVCVDHAYALKLWMKFKKWSCLTPTWQTKKHWDTDHLNNYFVNGSELEHHTIFPTCSDIQLIALNLSLWTRWHLIGWERERERFEVNSWCQWTSPVSVLNAFNSTKTKPRKFPHNLSSNRKNWALTLSPFPRHLCSSRMLESPIPGHRYLVPRHIFILWH